MRATMTAKNNHAILVSVILPIYNGQKYLKESIDSILTQTYHNLELIIINDGSTDNSEAVIQSFNDPRIRYYKQINHGLAFTLNRAIDVANGRYIARQDQDDLSRPNRLEKQVAFLEAHPTYGVVGTWANILVENKLTNRSHNHPTTNADIKFALLFDNPFVHSSVMMRKNIVNSVGGYSIDPSRQPPEDYELWSRLFNQCDFANIGEYLLKYRETHGSMSRVVPDPFSQKVIQISAENIARVLQRPNNDEVRILAQMAHQPTDSSGVALSELLNTLDRLAQKNGCNNKQLSQIKRVIKRNYLSRGWRKHPEHIIRLTTGATKRIATGIKNAFGGT